MPATMPGRLVLLAFVATEVFRILVFNLPEPVKLVRLKISRKLSSVVSKILVFWRMYVLRVAALAEKASEALAVVCLVGFGGPRFVHEVSFLGMFCCSQATRTVDALAAELVDVFFFLLRMIILLLMLVVFPSETTTDWETMMLPLSVLSTVSGSATVGAQKRKITKNMAYHA